ncbi:site-specific DNA-methyltransferase [Mycoplasmopsis anatis]|uniref:Site-specific DNA-methyltransferase n=1 Tax=Mycoplasmopsis anatis TaxID=171279 RepID=A0A9Q3L8G4_9BACT|nr:site-specific DNA-methyltransferase [Mycoplasmopsis anatis]MBW0594717.1 site-specific DNA-methyltransferase [Mycoplasmopsis anatis]MBW0595582.1 site-specific DNA-methyltransferase [Mycoplasmopsis anatis]MBW0596351.1 site-specific DNA-methyltransferase [Mycoplasmopsis anatis]MBW0597082.1 site-specific DNA-methyltransferase [Mycoplasmopsis anatis]MBW0597836.1 site-specific DNA-methyltransferase [Mycoplasmopsis anatis]
MLNKERSTRNKTIDFTVKQLEKELIRVKNIDSDIEKLDNVINSTINGDTFKILEKLPKNSIDLCIIDPPYNISKKFNELNFSRMKDDSYVEYTRKWINLIYPLLKETATIYVCCDWKTSMIIAPILAEKFYIQNRITWEREKGRGSKNNYKNSMEDIYFLTKSKNFYFNVDSIMHRKKVIAPYKENGKPKDWNQTEIGNFRNTYPSNIWTDISIPYWSMPENTAHPTQKPEKLIAKLVLASSKENDIVLDPFLGSGTTSVVAKKLNRKYIGIELDRQFCAWAEYRLEKAEQDKTIQGYADGVFWPRNSLSVIKKIKK